MADLHPTTGNVSTLATSPASQTNAIYRKQPFIPGQLGRATSYNTHGDGFLPTLKPTNYQLAAWDSARKKEPIIKQGLEYIVQAVMAKVGAFSHADSQIDDFVQANVSTCLISTLKDLLTSALWSGSGVSEIVYTRKNGPKDIPQIWFERFINYHPLQYQLQINDFGIIRDGDTVSNSQYKSGVWVPYPTVVQNKYSKSKDRVGNLVRLPKSKRVYITMGGEANNIWGQSIIESILPYHLFKEAYRDMMTVALDRYGTPLLYVVVPPLDTKEMVEEPDGSLRPLTLQEVTVREMQNLSAESALVFTQISKDQPIKIEALTTGNNFSDVFVKAIEFCDINMMMGLGIPNLLMRDTSAHLGSGGSSERQLQMFDNFISAVFDQLVNPFLEQAVLQLIQYNFDPRTNKHAYSPGSIQKKPTRSSELKTVVQALSDLTDRGFINPQNNIDFNYVRELIGLPTREPNRDDYILPVRRQARVDIKEQSEAALTPSTVPSSASLIKAA